MPSVSPDEHPDDDRPKLPSVPSRFLGILWMITRALLQLGGCVALAWLLGAGYLIGSGATLILALGWLSSDTRPGVKFWNDVIGAIVIAMLLAIVWPITLLVYAWRKASDMARARDDG